MRHGTTLGLLTAFFGSLWAYHKQCTACQNTPKFLGYSLAPIGVVFYGVTLAGYLAKRPLANKAVELAAWAHIPLAAYLLLSRNICPACFVTAIGALTAAEGLKP